MNVNNTIIAILYQLLKAEPLSGQETSLLAEWSAQSEHNRQILEDVNNGHLLQEDLQQRYALDKKAAWEKVFAQIILQTDVTIIYDEAILKKLPPVEIHVKDAQLADVLKTCLAGQGLSFEIRANIVNIKPLIPTAVLAVQPPKEVSGKVTDEKGNPIPGVVIVVKGTNVHTNTDANGNYTIKTPSENDVITFSYIGYVKQELPATDNLNVKKMFVYF